MKIVVLGGAGTIGRVIALDLVQDVDEIVIADLDFKRAKQRVEEQGP